MKRLLLARHGETDWNRSGTYQGHADIPLNELGRAQARALAERLVNEKIAALYASDLLRASETARIVGERLGLEPSFDEAWREMNVGSMTGMHHAEAPPHLREFISAAARSEDPVAPGAETFAQMESRLRTAYDQLTGETALIIGHGGTLKVLISILIGLPPQNIDRLSLRGNTSLTEISFAHNRPQLVMINDTRHHP
ncbi:MAG: histidine phosphatase family protein [Planctomycetota bacterium]|jgi:broad specificity phosphatase PhoE